MAHMLCATLLLGAALSSGGQLRTQQASGDEVDGAPTLALADYPRQLLGALALLDAGEHLAAAEGFERAGSCAPHAPVWRVHAGVARALAGERDAALVHFVRALEAGYAVDDLGAIAAWLAMHRAPDAATVVDVAAVAQEALGRAQVPDEARRSGWYTVSGARSDVVPYSAEARDHGTLVELAYEGRARRVSDTAGEWLESAAPLARHEFLDPWTLAVVAHIVPPRPAGLGFQIGPDGARTPLPDPRPVWVGANGESLDQRRFRELANAMDVPGLDLLSRGLRSGVWVASTRSVRGVTCEDNGSVVLCVQSPDSAAASLDVAHWRLGAFGSDLLGPTTEPAERSAVRSGALAGADAAAVAARASALGLRSLSQVAGDGPLLGLGSDAVVVLDPGTLAPIASLWLHASTLVVVAEDGTFLMDPTALDEALVTVGDVWVSARVVAPWLLDPLHLRSLASDTLRAARAFPVR